MASWDEDDFDVDVGDLATLAHDWKMGGDDGGCAGDGDVNGGDDWHDDSCRVESGLKDDAEFQPAENVLELFDVDSSAVVSECKKRGTNPEETIRQVISEVADISVKAVHMTNSGNAIAIFVTRHRANAALSVLSSCSAWFKVRKLDENASASAKRAASLHAAPGSHGPRLNVGAAARMIRRGMPSSRNDR